MYTHNCPTTVASHLLPYTGWTADDCKRLVLHPHFQGVIAHIKEQRLKFRSLYPNKPNVLRSPFNNCVGLDSTFDFDISTFNPRWQSTDEEGDAEQRAERAALRETRAARKAGTATPPPLGLEVSAPPPHPCFMQCTLTQPLCTLTLCRARPGSSSRCLCR